MIGGTYRRAIEILLELGEDMNLDTADGILVEWVVANGEDGRVDCC